MSTFRVQRRVEFCETDAAGIAHFSAFVLYMEQAEHAFLRHLGTSVLHADPGTDGHPVSWPRVRVECDYKGAAKFEDVLDISVSISRLGEKSITYRFQMERNSEILAIGSITAVCCEIRPEGIRGISIPQALRMKFQAFVAPAS